MGGGRLRNRHYHSGPALNSTRRMDISPISTNFPRKLNTGPQRKRRKTMPRGPKGEKRHADTVQNAMLVAPPEPFFPLPEGQRSGPSAGQALRPL